ncbi:MAG: PHB depolymerase family esterase, partial [Pseudomonadota bacterium]
ASSQATTPLPRIGAHAAAITVSGLSAGAYMAGQFQFAHAERVRGAALIAGGPFGCAVSRLAAVMPALGAVWMNLSRAINTCMLHGMRAFGEPNADRLAARARRLSEQGAIGDLAHVASDRIYLFSGTQDSIVAPGIVAAAHDFYTALGVPEAHIAFVNTMAAGHGFVTRTFGNACETSRPPYLSDCDFDQAGAILRHLLGRELLPAVTGATQLGALLSFDQRPFTKKLPAGHGLGTKGYVFIPPTCRQPNSRCRVHIVFHGCQQGADDIGDQLARQSGLNRWAATNGLIVLYPQVASTRANQMSCWDWWGYTGRGFLTRDASQIRAVVAMVDRLAMPQEATVH